MRMVPAFSVTRNRPSGIGSTPHGDFSPVATTCTSSFTLSRMPGARVWPGNAGS